MSCFPQLYSQLINDLIYCGMFYGLILKAGNPTQPCLLLDTSLPTLIQLPQCPFWNTKWQVNSAARVYVRYILTNGMRICLSRVSQSPPPPPHQHTHSFILYSLPPDSSYRLPHWPCNHLSLWWIFLHLISRYPEVIAFHHSLCPCLISNFAFCLALPLVWTLLNCCDSSSRGTVSPFQPHLLFVTFESIRIYTSKTFEKPLPHAALSLYFRVRHGHSTRSEALN